MQIQTEYIPTLRKFMWNVDDDIADLYNLGKMDAYDEQLGWADNSLRRLQIWMDTMAEVVKMKRNCTNDNQEKPDHAG